ncbi:MAG TPA: UPF0182 family protein [Firmicutes bacterium]|nr:UPF0182 family protein [Bacillota bacterium]
MRRKIWLFPVAGIILFVLVATGANFWMDMLWFKELNAEQVWWTRLSSQWGLRMAAWLLLFLFFYINLLVTRRYLVPIPNLKLRDFLIARGITDQYSSRWLTRFYLISALVVSGMLSSYTGGYWKELLSFFKAVPFQVSDPVFNLDVSFYLFKLPVYRFIYGYLMMAVVASLIVVGIIYLIINPVWRRWLQIPPAGWKHMGLLLSAAFGLKAWGYRLQQLQLVFSDRGKVFGAGYTDIFANLKVLQLLMVLALLIALAFAVSAFRHRPKLPVYAALILVAVSFLGGGIFPAAVQSLIVEPREFAYEKKYLEYNIDFTRLGYGLDKILPTQYTVGQDLAWVDLEQCPGTINNVRLWDYRPLLNTLNHLQAIRLYYRFQDVDIDRYTVDGDYRQVALAAREIDKSRFSAQAQTWVNMRLQYTHGYGVAVSPVNEVSAEGLPRFFVKDIPPVSREGLDLEQPSIYYGELTDDYVIVNTHTPESHYATAGDKNVYITYGGEGGIPLNSLWRRLLAALKFGEYRILISGELKPDSRLMFDRQVLDRVSKIAPFLDYDDDPYLVIHQGRLSWIVDAFTSSRYFPYSTPVGDLNYIRNSVKVVVDAYNGSVDFYIVDPGDPIVQTFSKVFPGLFRSREEMPEELLNHLRYPEDLFNLQSQVLTLYHTTDPNIIYSREDLWDIPVERYGDKEQVMEPYYTILELPGYQEEEFVLILPFTPSKRDNMIAWMVARCDGPHYGKIDLLLFPKDQVIMGPKQIENRIDQDTAISEQLTLWGQAGSRVIRGNLLVLPINNSLLYIEPIFLEAEGGGIPELARVIVVYQETVVMEETLQQALAGIFGEQEPSPESSEEQPPGGVEPVPEEEFQAAELIRRAQEVFEKAQQSLREGNWSGYGEKMSELEKIISALARLVN